MLSKLIEGRTHYIAAIPKSMISIFQSIDIKTHSLDILNRLNEYIIERDQLPELNEKVSNNYSDDEFKVKPLSSKEHAKIMSDHWKFADEFSKHYFEFQPYKMNSNP